MCRSNQRWRHVLDFVQTGTSPVTEAWLRNENIEGINAWDLSVMFESFIIDLLPKNMYNRRTQICGGEFGNGFELWRRLYLEFQGGDDAVQFGGMRRLQEFPKCENTAKLSEHLDDWLEVLSTYGTELESCPRLLRNMVLGIIPKALEQQILDESHRPEFRTHMGIIQFCRNRATQQRTKELSEIARRPGSIRSLKGRDADEYEPDGKGRNSGHMSWDKMKEEIVAQLRSSIDPDSSVPPPPEPFMAAIRTDRKAKPKPKAKPTKFMFKGCWHCGKEEQNHSRRNCPTFLDLLKKHNPGVSDRSQMKLPPGYKGAYERAREQAGLKTKRRVNAMLDDDEFESDSDFDESFPLPDHLKGLMDGRPIINGLMRPPRTIDLSDAPSFPTLAEANALTSMQPSPPFTNPNKFAALATTDDHDDDIGPLADDLNNWAHTVHRKPKNSKAAVVPKSLDIWDTVTVKSEADLDKLLQKCPKLAALPANDRKIRKALKSMPAELICGPDETLCLMDSGSTVNAAWIAKHFPAYANLVQSTPASRGGDYATTAGGQKLMNKGRCVVQATAGGLDFSPAFKDMETELPILSVRKIVRQQNDVQFGRQGGTIKNRKSGRTIKFHEYQGVYFLKLKVRNPDLMDVDDSIPPHGEPNIDSGFTRPGM